MNRPAPDTPDFALPARNRTRQLYDRLLPGFDQALQGLYRSIRDLLEGHELTPTIKYRVKRFADYYEKLQRNARKHNGPPDITDLFGLRIVSPFLEDVARIEKLLSGRFEVVETVFKAAGHSFREFGYDSVHLLIRLEDYPDDDLLPHTRPYCEIQLRTILQDAWAEVEHELVYKSRLTWPNESIRRKLAALNATLTLSDLTFQEIRDYQKNVRALDRKRRNTLENALALPDLEWGPATKDERVSDPAPLSVTAGSSLEKAMLKALEAHGRQEFALAGDLYTRILAMHLDPRIRALIYNHRGMALFALGRHREAIRDFSRALRFDADNGRALCNRGLVHRVQKRPAKALADYDQALEIQPASAEALLGRAQVYLEMRFPDRALTDCERALEIQPDLDAAKSLLEKLRRDFFTL